MTIMYEILTKRQFPGMRDDGSLGNRYEIVFRSLPLVERDSIIVDDLNSARVDGAIKTKIKEHEELAKLGR